MLSGAIPQGSRAALCFLIILTFDLTFATLKVLAVRKLSEPGSNPFAEHRLRYGPGAGNVRALGFRSVSVTAGLGPCPPYPLSGKATAVIKARVTVSSAICIASPPA